MKNYALEVDDNVSRFFNTRHLLETRPELLPAKLAIFLIKI